MSKKVDVASVIDEASRSRSLENRFLRKFSRGTATVVICSLLSLSPHMNVLSYSIKKLQSSILREIRSPFS